MHHDYEMACGSDSRVFRNWHWTVRYPLAQVFCYCEQCEQSCWGCPKHTGMVSVAVQVGNQLLGRTKTAMYRWLADSQGGLEGLKMKLIDMHSTVQYHALSPDREYTSYFQKVKVMKSKTAKNIKKYWCWTKVEMENVWRLAALKVAKQKCFFLFCAARGGREWSWWSFRILKISWIFWMHWILGLQPLPQWLWHFHDSLKTSPNPVSFWL